MKSVNFSNGLVVAAAFIFALSAPAAFADKYDRDHASDKGNNVDKAFPVKNSQKDQHRANKPSRDLDAKHSDRKGSGSNSNATSGGKTDSSTIGKGTGNPETTTLGSGTGWSGSDD